MMPIFDTYCKEEFLKIKCAGSSPHFMSSVQAPQPIKSDPDQIALLC